MDDQRWKNLWHRNYRNLDTTGQAPGSYTVTGTATDPKEKKNNTASCNASFTVKAKPMNPPQVTCSASPSTVKSGDASTITATASSPDNAQITGYAYQASAGRSAAPAPRRPWILRGHRLARLA